MNSNTNEIVLQRQFWKALGGIVALGALIYSNSFFGEFCSDDIRLIVENNRIRDMSNLKDIWYSFNTRFLVGLSFAFNYWAGHLNVFGYHLFNFLCHIIAAGLVYGFVLMTFRTPKMRRNSLLPHAHHIALFSALTFLCHPMQTQGVSYITQRFVSMATIFYLGTLLFYVKARLEQRNLYYGLALAMMFSGLFSKEVTLTLPIMLIVYESVFFESWNKEKLKLSFLLLPFMLLTEIFLFAFAQDRDDSVLAFKNVVAAQTFSWDYFFTEINVLRTYLRMLVFPINQKHHYFYPIVHGFWEPATIFSFCLLLGLFIFAVLQIKTRKLMGFSIVWFFITTSVEAGMVCFMKTGVIYDHWLYLPMVGFSIFMTVVLFEMINNAQMIKICLVLSITIFAIMTYQRNRVWQNPISLWTDTLTQSPRIAWPYVRLGLAYGNHGNHDKAIESFQKAIQAQPNLDVKDSAQIYVNLGAAYGRKGDYGMEFQMSQRAIKLDPSNAQGYGNAGMACSAIGDLPAALSFFQKALELNPRDSNAYNNLGMIYGKRGDIKRAVYYFEQAIRLNPDHSQTRQNLSLALKHLPAERP